MGNEDCDRSSIGWRRLPGSTAIRASMFGGRPNRTANRLRNWVEGPARSGQKIGPGRGHRNSPGVNEPANATPGQGTQFRNALEGRRNRTSQGGLFSPAPPLGRRNLFAQNLGLRSESRLPQATIPGSSGAQAPLLIQHLYPLHCTQRGDLRTLNEWRGSLRRILSCAPGHPRRTDGLRFRRA
jgi:hypothetical protein